MRTQTTSTNLRHIGQEGKERARSGTNRNLTENRVGDSPGQRAEETIEDGGGAGRIVLVREEKIPTILVVVGTTQGEMLICTGLLDLMVLSCNDGIGEEMIVAKGER